MEHIGTTDAELLTRLADGDQQALALIFDRHAAAVTRYAWALAPTRMDVEEVVQDTFLTAWRKATTVTIAETSMLPWLLVTCRYLAFNANRKQAKNRAGNLSESDRAHRAGLGGGTEPADQAREELRWVMDEIQRLAPVDRRICELCLIEGRPYQEVADELGLSVGAVKQRVSRNRARLRKAVTVDEN
ncbi:RNA polymerase sigma factor [Agromyces arachidis]